ncbi:MAG: HAD family hydrolase [Leptospiraceae bacterium]|nr:HAD family hydrolase [Leptospiraceae bacterium]
MSDIKKQGFFPKAILFDMDGTLVDTWKLYIHSYLATLKTVLNRDVNLEELRSWKPTTEIRLFQSLLKEDWKRAYELFVNYYNNFHEGLFEGVYPNVVECLNELQKKDIKLGIVTGKSRAAYDITSRYIPFDKWNVVICDDDVKEPKPSSEGLLKALEFLKVQETEAIYVGDAIVDVYASLSTNVEFAGVLWCKSHTEKKDFIRHATSLGAGIFLNKPEDLFEFFET